MKHPLVLAAIVIITVCLAIPSYAINILIWDNDVYASFLDPDNYTPVGCQNGIEKALAANGYTCFTTYYLPSDLSQYDLIFIVLGFYCPS